MEPHFPQCKKASDLPDSEGCIWFPYAFILDFYFTLSSLSSFLILFLPSLPLNSSHWLKTKKKTNKKSIFTTNLNKYIIHLQYILSPLVTFKPKGRGEGQRQNKGHKSKQTDIDTATSLWGMLGRKDLYFFVKVISCLLSLAWSMIASCFLMLF